MTNILSFVNNSVDSVIHLTKRTKNKINYLKSKKIANRSIKVKNKTKNDSKLNEKIKLFIQHINKLLQKVDEIIQKENITNIHILTYLSDIKKDVIQMNQLLQRNNSNKYNIIITNIGNIRRFITDIIDKRSEFISNDIIEELSNEIISEIEEINISIKIMNISGNNINELEERIKLKKELKQKLQNKLEQNIGQLNKPFMGSIRTTAQKKYNLSLSSMRNRTLRNKNTLNKEINDLEKELKIKRNIKNRK